MVVVVVVIYVVWLVYSSVVGIVGDVVDDHVVTSFYGQISPPVHPMWIWGCTELGECPSK